jgi:hypothetical protein
VGKLQLRRGGVKLGTEREEGVQNAIEEANPPGKEAKGMARELKEEKEVARNLAALEVPKSKGVRWDKVRSVWQVQKQLGEKKWSWCFSFDDHKKAVAMYESIKSKTEAELKALKKYTIDNRQ